MKGAPASCVTWNSISLIIFNVNEKEELVGNVARGPWHFPATGRWQFCGIAACTVQTEVSGQPTLWPINFHREHRIEMESYARPVPPRVFITNST